MASRLTLTVLIDNATLTDRYFTAEPGLSFLLETIGKKILFDAGYSRVFPDNAGKRGMDLRDLDFVVLSHGGFDHSRGLVPLVQHLTEARMEGIASPLCFCPLWALPRPGIVLVRAEELLQSAVDQGLSPWAPLDSDHAVSTCVVPFCQGP